MSEIKQTREQLPSDKKPDQVKERTLSIKELLLSGPRFDLKLPRRKKWRRRPPVIFD